MHTNQARLEDERRHAIGKLHQLRGSGEITGAEIIGIDEIADEADRAQASLRQHLEMATYERLVDRIGRLTEALQRLAEGTYGTCEHCGTPIAGKRLKALPEATSCIACQTALERLEGQRLVEA